MDARVEASPGPALDADSRAWLDALAGTGPTRDDAVARLHGLLLRGARFTLSRRRGAYPHVRGDDLDDLAHQAAGDALVALLARLHAFRGESRFTTWAYGFAVLEASTKLRRRAWQGREIPLAEEGWQTLADPGERPEAALEQRELLAALREAMTTALTPHQREVLVAVVLNGVPIDVLAERLGTSRNALYKTVHDARARLRTALGEEL